MLLATNGAALWSLALQHVQRNRDKLSLYRDEVDLGPFLNKTLNPAEVRQPRALQHPQRQSSAGPQGWAGGHSQAKLWIAMRCQLIWECPHSTVGGDSGTNGLGFILPSLILELSSFVSGITLTRGFVDIESQPASLPAAWALF